MVSIRHAPVLGSICFIPLRDCSNFFYKAGYIAVRSKPWSTTKDKHV